MTPLDTVTATLTDVQRRRSDLVDLVERLEMEHAHLTGALAVFRPMLRSLDRTLNRAMAAHAAVTAREHAPELPAIPAHVAVEAVVVDPARTCLLCPHRGPFPTVQGLRLHEQRTHPEIVRERRQQAARDLAAESAYPSGRGAK